MTSPTPTLNQALPFRSGHFQTLAEGLDYAAQGETGLNYYSVRGELLYRLTYGEVREKAISIAQGLLSFHPPKGARVVLLAETSPTFHCFFLACQYASLAPVPLPLPMTLGGKEAYIEQLRQMIASAQPTFAIAPDEFIGHLKSAVEDLSIPHVGPQSHFEALSSDAPLRPTEPDALSYLQYSSGSTSEPKGVKISQRCITANARGIIEQGLQARPGDRCTSWLPLYHDMGLVGFFLTPMLCQLSVDYQATADFARRPLMWLRLISENRSSLAFSPSFGYELCHRRADKGSPDLDLSSWRAAGIGGDMVRPEVLENFARTFASVGFRRQAFVPSYGLAESTLAVSFVPLQEGFQVDRVDRALLSTTGRAEPATDDAPHDQTRSFVICGKPMIDHEITVRSPAGRDLPERRVGRILIRGPSIMEGFFDRPDATAEVLSDDGWLDTGDLGYLVDGSLVITGRSKDLIICNGRNIWPQDVEWAVERLDGLRSGDVAAFSVDEVGGEQLVTVVQCRIQEPRAREKLAQDIYSVVRRTAGVDCKVVFAAPRSLPMTSSGKLSRSSTKARFLSGSYATAG